PELPLKATPSVQSLTDRIVLQRFAPSGILTNEKGDILYISGRTGKYLEPPTGKANWNIFAMAREGLRYDLTNAFAAAVREERQVVTRNIRVATNGTAQTVDLTVEKLLEPEQLRGSVLLIITDVAAPARPAGTTKGKLGSATKVNELEDELQQARQEAQ